MGHRVVVRRIVGTGSHGRPVFTDVTGDLVEIGEERLVVRAADGVRHAVAIADVAAAKRIPPRPARYSEIAALERLADAAWPAPTREHLGEWVLRAAEGFTSRANSALPLGDPALPLAEAVDACARWYRARDLTPRITVPLPLRRDVASTLAARGWHAQPLVLVQTAGLIDVAGDPMIDPVLLTREPSEGVLGIIGARKRGLPPSARYVLSGVPEVRFAEIRDGSGDGAPLAIARGAIVDDWLHIGLVEVVERARRRGLARRVSRALARWAADSGATRAVLQVEEQNTAAVGLYAVMGFRTHHRYVTYGQRSA